jgi:hypothetical protein
MTQPPSPEQLATTEEIHAGADEFVNTVLTDAVSRLDARTDDLPGLTGHIGVGLIEMDASRKELTVIAARALARLARLHHAAEQLAAEHDANAEKHATPHEADVGNGMAAAFRVAAAELRKLVDDHG